MDWIKLIDEMEHYNKISIKEAAELREFSKRVDDGLEKEANIISTLAGKTKGLAQSAIKAIGQHKETAIVLMLTAPAIHGLGTAMIEPIKRKADYDRMKEFFKNKFPSEYTYRMKQPDGEKQLKDAFGLIRTFSPKVSSSAPVAAAAVNEYFAHGAIGSDLLRNLVTIESKAPSTPGHFAAATQRGAINAIATEVEKSISGALEITPTSK